MQSTHKEKQVTATTLRHRAQIIEATKSGVVDPILRMPEVLSLTGARSRQTIYNWMDKGDFPKAIKIGPNTIGWRKSVCESWLESKAAV